MVESTFEGVKFTDADVINNGEFIPGDDKYNPRKVRPWLLHDHGFCVCVVFASCEQDALDTACNENKLDRYQIKNQPDMDEYCTYLGNASEPFDIESLGLVEMPNPKFSFCALFNAQQEDSKK